MNKFIILCISFLIIIAAIQAVNLNKKKKSSDKLNAVTCANPVSLLNRGLNLPLYFKPYFNKDGSSPYADTALGLENSAEEFHKFCILPDGRIQHIHTGLYLIVHGLGYFCTADATCEWHTEIDGFPTQGTTWTWTDKLVGGFHVLSADSLGGTLTGFKIKDVNGKEQAFVNLADRDPNNVNQEWIFYV